MPRPVRYLLALAAWWGWIPLLGLLGWLIGHQWLFTGLTWRQDFDQWLMANVWHGHALAWWWVLVGALGTVVITLAVYEDPSEPAATYHYHDSGDRASWSRETPGTSRDLIGGVLYVVGGVLAAIAVVMLVRILWDNDKDGARFYNQRPTTQFLAPSLDTPPISLQRLTAGDRPSPVVGCARVGAADVPSCLNVGPLPGDGWDPRTGSLEGATKAIEATAASFPNVSLNEATVNYLNGGAGTQPSWSGILDGHGITQPLGGVATWNGGNVSQCLFRGAYALDRAFSGSRANSLPNLLAERFPTVRWTISDVWGYCRGDQPVVVIPATRQVYFKSRTVDTAAGVIEVTGDHGHTRLTRLPTVAAGTLPGPVYPLSLAARQRQQATWAAGRQNRGRNGFGFEPTDADAQRNNVSEYLLRDHADGRLDYVTPLTLGGSSSQLFVAYSLVDADTVTDGRLNGLRIYALADNDPRRVNIQTLESDAKTYVQEVDPGFFPGGGTLIEYTPVNGDTFRVFGEVAHRVKYRLDISAGHRIQPVLAALDNSTPPTNPGQPPAAVSDVCGRIPQQLTPQQLTTCAGQFLDELRRRQGGR